MDAISIPISFGEFIDKVTILEIKQEQLSDPIKLKTVRSELQMLRTIREQRFGTDFGDATILASRLKHINIALWNIEDAIRDCERRRSFDEEFVRLARAVYSTNDQRAAIKREIDVLLGSPLREEKSYKPYD